MKKVYLIVFLIGLQNIGLSKSRSMSFYDLAKNLDSKSKEQRKVAIDFIYDSSVKDEKLFISNLFKFISKSLKSQDKAYGLMKSKARDILLAHENKMELLIGVFNELLKKESLNKLAMIELKLLTKSKKSRDHNVFLKIFKSLDVEDQRKLFKSFHELDHIASMSTFYRKLDTLSFLESSGRIYLYDKENIAIRNSIANNLKSKDPLQGLLYLQRFKKVFVNNEDKFILSTIVSLYKKFYKVRPLRDNIKQRHQFFFGILNSFGDEGKRHLLSFLGGSDTSNRVRKAVLKKLTVNKGTDKKLKTVIYTQLLSNLNMKNIALKYKHDYDVIIPILTDLRKKSRNKVISQEAINTTKYLRKLLNRKEIDKKHKYVDLRFPTDFSCKVICQNDYKIDEKFYKGLSKFLLSDNPKFVSELAYHHKMIVHLLESEDICKRLDKDKLFLSAFENGFTRQFFLDSKRDNFINEISKNEELSINAISAVSSYMKALKLFEKDAIVKGDTVRVNLIGETYNLSEKLLNIILDNTALSKVDNLYKIFTLTEAYDLSLELKNKMKIKYWLINISSKQSNPFYINYKTLSRVDYKYNYNDGLYSIAESSFLIDTAIKINEKNHDLEKLLSNIKDFDDNISSFILAFKKQKKVESINGSVDSYYLPIVLSKVIDSINWMKNDLYFKDQLSYFDLLLDKYKKLSLHLVEHDMSYPQFEINFISHQKLSEFFMKDILKKSLNNVDKSICLDEEKDFVSNFNWDRKKYQGLLK